MEGFIATALVLVQRAGAEPARSGGDGWRDVQVSGPSTRLPEDGTAGRWAELTARYARSMPH